MGGGHNICSFLPREEGVKSEVSPLLHFVNDTFSANNNQQVHVSDTVTHLRKVFDVCCLVEHDIVAREKQLFSPKNIISYCAYF